MPPAVPPAAPSPQGATAVKLDQLLGDLRKLPLLPATAQQAMALANERNASLQELGNLLERDVTLASSILKLANSPIFSWGKSVDSLDKAVIRLGLRECQNLIVAISMRNLFHQTDPVTKGLCAVLWHHCFLTACLCRRLNRELRCDFHGEEFSAGLLHDLGRVLLAVSVPKHFQAADPMDFVENAETLVREQQLLDTDHCHLGTLYAAQNGLPPAAVTAIGFHHRVHEGPDHHELLGLVATADHMANYLQRREPPNDYDVNLNHGFVFMSRGWPSEKKDSFARFVPVLMIETESAAKPQSGLRRIRPGVAVGRSGSPNEADSSADKSVWGNVKGLLGL
jgi:HD-like signal output (HDOD) protein